MNHNSRILSAVLCTMSASSLWAQELPWLGTIKVRKEVTFKKEQVIEHENSRGFWAKYEDIKEIYQGVFQYRNEYDLKVDTLGTYKYSERVDVESETPCHTTSTRNDLILAEAKGQNSEVIEGNGASVSIGADGVSYTVSLNSAGLLEGPQKSKSFFSTKNTCPVNVTEYTVEDGLTWHWGAPAVTGTGALKDNPDHIQGSSRVVETKENERTVITMTWDLRRKADPKVTAVVAAPTSLERTKVLTLDGSKSKGPIESFQWEIEPGEDCPELAKKVKLIGKKVSFTLLCPVTATLTVRGKGDQDSETAVVGVSSRPWKTVFKEEKERSYSGTLLSGWMDFGKNRCSTDLAEPNHWIHKTAEKQDWNGSGYNIAQIEDANSPFDGLWYLKNADLKVHRVSMINSKILPGGEIYAINNAMGNLKNVTLLLKQIRAHEKAHSKLAMDRLKTRWSTLEDPAYKIESFISADADQLVENANTQISITNGDLEGASAETEVKAILHKVKEFQQSGFIYLPESEGGEPKKVHIEAFADLGDE